MTAARVSTPVLVAGHVRWTCCEHCDVPDDPHACKFNSGYRDRRHAATCPECPGYEPPPPPPADFEVPF